MMNYLAKNLIVGSGGHAQVLFHELSEQNPTFYLDIKNDSNQKNIIIDGELSIDDLIKTYNFYFGIGAVNIKSINSRKKVFENYKKNTDFIFKTFKSQSAIINSTSKIGEGSVIMAGSIIQSDVQIGVNSIINTGSIIEHNVKIGNHCHIGPGAIVAGGVQIGDCCFIGAGSVIIQSLSLGSGSILAAGSVLKSDVDSNELWAGNPSKKI